MGKHVDRIKNAIGTVKATVEKFNILKDTHFVELIKRVEALEVAIKELLEKINETKAEAVEAVEAGKDLVEEAKKTVKDAKGKTKEDKQ